MNRWLTSGPRWTRLYVGSSLSRYGPRNPLYCFCRPLRRIYHTRKEIHVRCITLCFQHSKRLLNKNEKTSGSRSSPVAQPDLYFYGFFICPVASIVITIEGIVYAVSSIVLIPNHRPCLERYKFSRTPRESAR